MEHRRPAVVVEVGVGMSADALGQLSALVAGAAEDHTEVVCLVRGADLGVVDTLAKVQLLCRRSGLRCRVRATPAAMLAGLLELTGLREALPGELEVLGQAEAPEQ